MFLIGKEPWTATSDRGIEFLNPADKALKLQAKRRAHSNLGEFYWIISAFKIPDPGFGLSFQQGT